MQTFLKIVLTFAFSILLISPTYADQKFSSVEKTFILRITSQSQKKQSVPFTGSYVVTGKNGYRVIHFFMTNQKVQHVNTPYEETVKGSALSTMIVSVNNPQVDNIKVEILEKQDEKEIPIMSGTGLTIVSTNDTNLVFNNIYAK